jgi:hypothetical protein
MEIFTSADVAAAIALVDEDSYELEELLEHDDSGQMACLIRAAAEAVVDHMNQTGEVLDAAAVLLGYIPSEALENTILQHESEQSGETQQQAPVPPPSLERPEHSLAYGVYMNGRWWKWNSLVRALDGFVKIEDRGRKMRFWNGMGGHYQAPAARREARAAAHAAAMAAEGLGDGEHGEEDAEDGDTLPEDGAIQRGSFVAVWKMGTREDSPGELVVVKVHALAQRAPKKGYVMADSTNPTVAEAGFLKAERYEYDEATHQLRRLATGGLVARFLRLPAADTHKLLSPEADGTNLRLPEAEAAALHSALPALREMAIAFLRRMTAAKARAHAAGEQRLREAGAKDITKLTKTLLLEELKARKERGEDVTFTTTLKKDALQLELMAARRAAPDIPAAVTAAVAVGVDDDDDAVVGAAAAPRVVPSATLSAAPAAVDEAAGIAAVVLVGLRCSVQWGGNEDDEGGERPWYPALIVDYYPNIEKRRANGESDLDPPYLIHFDDGMWERVGLPDETIAVSYGEQAFSVCTCKKCALYGEGNRSVPLKWAPSKTQSRSR